MIILEKTCYAILMLKIQIGLIPHEIYMWFILETFDCISINLFLASTVCSDITDSVGQHLSYTVNRGTKQLIYTHMVVINWHESKLRSQ